MQNSHNQVFDHIILFLEITLIVFMYCTIWITFVLNLIITYANIML